MNNDYLRVNSKTNEENIAVSEFKNERKQREEPQKQKMTLMTLLSFSRANDSPELRAKNLPKFKGLMTIFFVNLFATFLLSFIAFLTSDVIILMFTATVASLLIPLFLLVFFYQFNTKKDVTFLEIVVGSVIGISIYILSSFVEVYVNEFIYFDWIKEIVDLIFRDCVVFISAIAFVRIAKKDGLYGAMMLSICVYAGYIFAHSLDLLISSLFISVQITSGDKTYETVAIILGEESFKAIIDSFLGSFLKESLYTSIIVSCYAIINGGLIGMSTSPLKDDKYREWSLYILFFITIVLHLGAIFPSTIRFFEIILKTLSTVFSVTLAITILNYFLSKTHFDNE